MPWNDIPWGTIGEGWPRNNPKIIVPLSIHCARVLPSQVSGWDDLPQIADPTRIIQTARGDASGYTTGTVSASASFTVTTPGEPTVSCTTDYTASDFSVFGTSRVGSILDRGVGCSLWFDASSPAGWPIAKLTVKLLAHGDDYRLQIGGLIRWLFSDPALSPPVLYAGIQFYPGATTPETGGLRGDFDFLGVSVPFCAAKFQQASWLSQDGVFDAVSLSVDID